MPIQLEHALPLFAKRTQLTARTLATLIVSLVVLVFPATAFAYPSSVVFSPNGEAKPLGTVSLLAYGAVNLAPKASPGSSWFGIQAGILPQWQYGDSGVSFGGLEAGFDCAGRPVLPSRAWTLSFNVRLRGNCCRP